MSLSTLITDHPIRIISRVSYHKLLILNLLISFAPFLSDASPASTYDFVIVGAGTAGCTLAARLCVTLPSASILLLERGATRNASEEHLVRAARLGFDAQSNPNLAAISFSEPEDGLDGRRFDIISGHSLGGLSAINGGHLVPPLDADIRRWSFAGLSPERARRLYSRVLRVLRAREPPRALQQDYMAQWREAAETAGIRFASASEAATAPKNDSFFSNPTLAFNATGARADACSAYLPIVNRRTACRLRVRQSASVDRLLVKGGGRSLPRITGLLFRTASGKVRRVLARREVLLSAGPLDSPSVLLRSGVGPRGNISKLPVGRFARSRPLSIQLSAYAGVPLAPTNNRSVVYSKKARKAFEEGRKGALGVAIAGTAGRVGLSALAEASTALPDVSGGLGNPLLVSACLPNPSSDGRASIFLNKEDRLAAARIKLNFYAGRRDMPRMLDCVRATRAVHGALSSLLGSVEVLGEGLTPEALEDAATLEAFVRGTTRNGYHLVGGCAKGLVTTRWFRVKGVRGVRVVDASVIPTIPRGAGPMASVYILAEHAAAFLARRHADLGAE